MSGCPRSGSAAPPTTSGCPRCLAFGHLGDHKCQPSALGSSRLPRVVSVVHRLRRPTEDETAAGAPGARSPHNERVPQVPRFWAPGMRILATPRPESGPPEGTFSHRTRTVNINTNKSRSFNALSQYPVQFQRILQKMLQFSATLCLQNLNSQQPIRAHALSTIQRPRRNANL